MLDVVAVVVVREVVVEGSAREMMNPGHSVYYQVSVKQEVMSVF